MNRVLGAGTIVLCSLPLLAHDPNATITWNRDISRVVFDRCVSCHRPEGTSFPLTTYHEVQPRAAAITDSVLSRRMPPWGAVKGFGSFQNDAGLSQEQMMLITDWVETGALRGNNPNVLPPLPAFTKALPSPVPGAGLRVSGDHRLDELTTLTGVFPERVSQGTSMQVVAIRPGGATTPLIWIDNYAKSSRHPFLFRVPVVLPAGTVVRGVPRDATLLLMSDRQ
jgi:hypothetical protein